MKLQILLAFVLLSSLVLGVTSYNSIGINFERATSSVGGSYFVNITTADFWDALDTPADIVGSVFWYNQTTATYDSYDTRWTACYNVTYESVSSGTYNATYDIWAYNQTIGDGSYNSTYDSYAYNMTTPAMTYEYNQTQPANDYADSLVGGTFNSTYDTYAYNQTTPAMNYEQNHTSLVYDTWGDWFYNMTQPFTDWLSSFLYNYNQTAPAEAYADSLVGGTFNTTYDATSQDVTANRTNWLSKYNITYESTYNETYNTWAYNMTIGTGVDGSYNETYVIWSYNQTQPFINWLSTFVYNYNQTIENPAWLSTYNVTYHNNMNNASFNQSLTDLLYANIKWNYNQTIVNTDFYNVSYESTYNSTYDSYAYNMTTPAITYTNALDIKNIKAEDDWRMFYSDTTGMQLLALGTAGTYLKSNGEASPSWATPGAYNITYHNSALTNHTSIANASIFGVYNTLWTAVYNSSYALTGTAYNVTYESTYNITYHNSALTNHTLIANASIFGVYNTLWLSTYNVSYADVNKNNTFKFMTNFTQDITINNKSCYKADCSSYIWNNGSTLILQA
jgi:hypothetical protein